MPSLMELLGELGHALDTPGAYLRGALAARPGERVSGRELFGLEDDAEGSIIGLLAEMGLDPLNLLTAGGAGVAKAALPAIALSRLDKASDAARAGMKLEDVLAQHKVVDRLLDAGVMPRELAEKTQFARTRYHPKEGVSPEEIVDQYAELFSGVGDYRGETFTDEEILGLIKEQMAEPVGPSLAGYANPDEASVIADLDRLVDEGDLGALREEMVKERLDLQDPGGFAPLRAMIPEGDPLLEMLEGFKEIQPAQHMTSSRDLERFSDLLTSGGNIPTEMDLGSGSWGGEGVYATTLGKTPAYVGESEGRRRLAGTIFAENPLVIPGQFYGEEALQDFMRANKHMFPELAPGQEDLIMSPRSGVAAEKAAGLDELEDAESAYDVMFAKKQRDAVQEWEYLSDSQKSQVGVLLEESGSSSEAFRELIDDFARVSTDPSGEGPVSFEEYLSQKLTDYGEESSALGRSGDNYLDAHESVALADAASEEATKASLMDFTPSEASDIARRQGYDSVIFTEGRDLSDIQEETGWMDELFMSGDYEQFREAVLEDPDFWLEINMLYPETAERYLDPGPAGFSVPRTGDPGHGQLFNIVDDMLVAPEKLPLPNASKSRVPGKDVQKAILLAIGVGGMNEALQSMQKKRELAA